MRFNALTIFNPHEAFDAHVHYHCSATKFFKPHGVNTTWFVAQAWRDHRVLLARDLKAIEPILNELKKLKGISL